MDPLDNPKLPEKLDPYSATHFGRVGSSPTVVMETWAGSCAARSVMSFAMGMTFTVICTAKTQKLIRAQDIQWE